MKPRADRPLLWLLIAFNVVMYLLVIPYRMIG